MNISKRAFTINGLIFWLALSSVLCGSDAEMKTLYMEDLCNDGYETKLSLRYYSSAILASIPAGPMDCKLQLIPEYSPSSIVIAFYRYNLEASDQLVFRDKYFKLSPTGKQVFLDEGKSLTFDGPLTIRYVTNYTSGPRLKFQVVFTEIRDGPCSRNEFKCRNGKCIPKDLACDKHNHCGDLSDQQNCSPGNNKNPEVIEYRKTAFPWAIVIIITSVIFGIIFIVLIAVAIRGCVVKKKQTQQPPLPTTATPTATATATEVPQAEQPSVFGRLRQSFRFNRPTAPPLDAVSAPEHTPSENYEVPSMYPRLPAAQRETGTDNPEFKADE